MPNEINVLMTLQPPAPVVAEEPLVSVTVNGRLVRLPERALSVGLSDLRLATEAHVGLADYAEGVGLVLAALERCSLLAFRV
jgi:hypothetical protein